MIKFRTFVTICCINKLQSQLKEGINQWNSPVWHTLLSWKPSERDKVESFWVTKPMWTVSFKINHENLLKDMKSRTSNDGSEEWEFSIETAQVWSRILAMLLKNINDEIANYKEIPLKRRQRPLEDSRTLDIIETIISLYSALFILIFSFKRVVKALLAVPSLASSFLPKAAGE